MEEVSDSVDLVLLKACLKEKYNLREPQQEKLIKVSAQSIKESLDNAEEALAERDLQALSEYAHKLKGTLLIMSLDTWADKADEIHSAAERGSKLNYATLLREIRGGLKMLCEQGE